VTRRTLGSGAMLCGLASLRESGKGRSRRVAVTRRTRGPGEMLGVLASLGDFGSAFRAEARWREERTDRVKCFAAWRLWTTSEGNFAQRRSDAENAQTG